MKVKRNGREETEPDEADLDIDADPNEYDERNEGGEG